MKLSVITIPCKFTLLTSCLTCFSLTQSVTVASSNETEPNLNFPNGYRSNRPPVKDGKPVITEMRIIIYQVAEIDETHRNIKLNLLLALEWKDYDVSIKEDIIVLRTDQVNQIWKPFIHVSNMESMVPRAGMTGVMYASNDHTIRSFYGCILVIPCPFDFTSYPFDIQVCDVNLTMRMFPKALALLKWKSKNPVRFDSYKGNTFQQLPKYSVSVCAVDKETFYRGLAGDFSRLIVRFILTRDLNNYILSHYFPSTMFVMVSWCSFLVTPTIVPGRVVLIVTTLLTLVTMYESNLSYSPPSSTIQCLNAWLLGCIIFVFATLAEYSLVLFKVRANSSKTTTGVRHIKMSHTEHITLYPRRKIANLKEKMYSPFKRFLARIRRYLYNPNWTPHDRVSLFLFPVVFFAYSLGYWCFFLHNRDDKIPRDECK